MSIGEDVFKLLRKCIYSSALAGEVIDLNEYHITRDDLINDIYVAFYEKEYDKKFSPDQGKLSSYVYKFAYWYMQVRKKEKIAMRKRGHFECTNINFDYFIDERLNPEQDLIDKETEKLLDTISDDNMEWVEGTTQQEMGDRDGVTRQAIHDRIRRERLRLKKRFRDKI